MRTTTQGKRRLALQVVVCSAVFAGVRVAIGAAAVLVPEQRGVAGVEGEGCRSTRLTDTGGRRAVQEMRLALVLDPDSPELRAERLRHSGFSLLNAGDSAPKPRKHAVRPTKSIVDRAPESRQPPVETATATSAPSATQKPVEVVAPLPQAVPSPGAEVDNPNGGAAKVEPAAGSAMASRSDSSVNRTTTYAATLVVVLAGFAGAYLIGRRRGARRREGIASSVPTKRTSISDWFRPKWKHSDPAVRLAAVERLADQPTLADIAKNDKDSKVRKAAMARVTEQYDLADVAQNSLDSKVRKAAVERLEDQLVLAEIAKNDKDSEVRRAAVARVTDERLLADIAKSGLDSEVRKAAVARVTDERLLADIAVTEERRAPHSFWVIVRRGPHHPNESWYVEQLTSHFAGRIPPPQKVTVIANPAADIGNPYFRAAILVRCAADWGVDASAGVAAEYTDGDGYQGVVISWRPAARACKRTEAGGCGGIQCSACNAPIEFIGGIAAQCPNADIAVIGGDGSSMDLWRGQICSQCRRVYCGSCIELGRPSPCPSCGTRTEPANRRKLEQIGLIRPPGTGPIPLS